MIHPSDRQTDRQTDGWVLSRAKKEETCINSLHLHAIV